MLDIFKTKKFKLLLAMISLLILTNTIQESYAKYISSASANSNFSIAEWTFKVNDQDVLNNSDFSSTIVPVIDSNKNIRDGYIAPSSTGYFDVNIDFSEVGVSFQENIRLSSPANSSLTDLVLVGYSKNGEELTSINSNSISIIHSLGETQTRDNYRFYIKWIDGSGESMNNEQDTLASTEGSTQIKVDLNFIQLAN